MREISLVICDNERTVCEQLKKMAEQLAGELHLSIGCKSCYSAEELVETDLDDYNILFLDIEMEGKNGFWAAEQIRKTNQRIEIVFATVLAQMCSEGYRYNAYRYLIKPVEYDRFRMELKYLFERTAAKEHIYRSIKDGVDNQLPVYADICYIEVIDHTVYYHTSHIVVEKSGTMKKTEETYRELGFCRIHQSYLVNMEKIESILPGKILLEDKTELVVSRSRAKEFKNQYANFMADKLM